MSLYEGETRIFHGWVVDTVALLYGVRVVVQGSGWWLARAEVTTTRTDDVGGSKERPIITFPEQDVAASLATVFATMRTQYGLPVRLGEVSTTYTIPAASWRLTSWADVIADLLAWVPDAVGWWDHSAVSGTCAAATATTITLEASASTTDDFYNGAEIEVRDGSGNRQSRVIVDYVGATRIATVAPWTSTPSAGHAYTIETDPLFRVTRRGSAPSIAYDLSSADLVEPFELRPRTELKTEQVLIPYVVRNSTGAKVFAEQVAGSYVAGARQIVPVSGEELFDFLPADQFESYAFSAAGYSNASTETAALLLDPQFGPAKAAGLTTELTFCGPDAEVYQGYSTSAGTTLSDRVTISPGTITTKATGLPASTLGKHLLLSAAPPDWWLTAVGAIQVTVAGTWSYRLLTSRYEFPYGAGDVVAIEPVPAWVEQLTVASAPSGGFIQQSPWRWATQVLRGTFPFESYLVPNTVSSGTAYKAQDFGFLAPPDGLAANLLSASNWLPWEGVITRRTASTPTGSLLGSKFSVSGSLPSLASAGALPKAQRFDFASMTMTIDLGPPPRSDYRSLVGRVAANPADTVVQV